MDVKLPGDKLHQPGLTVDGHEPLGAEHLGIEVIEEPLHRFPADIGAAAENQGIDAEAPDFRPSRRVIFPELLAYMHALGSGDETLAEAEVLKAADLLLERLVDHHLTRIPRSRDFLMKVVGSST